MALWAHAPATADPAQLDALLHGSDRPLLVIAAGPGWAVESVPAEVAVPHSLPDAVAILVAAARPLVGHT